MTKIENDLARIKKFLEQAGLSDKYSVTYQDEHYVLIHNEIGHTHTIEKFSNMDELISYFTAKDTKAASVWDNTRSDTNGAENVNTPTKAINKPAEPSNSDALFELIKPDVSMAIAISIMVEGLSIHNGFLENEYIGPFVFHLKDEYTSEIIDYLEEDKSFNLEERLRELTIDVAKDLVKRGITVYHIGKWRDSERREAELEWLMTNKKKGLAWITESTIDDCEAFSDEEDSNYWEGMTYKEWRRTELGRIFCQVYE